MFGWILRVFGAGLAGGIGIGFGIGISIGMAVALAFALGWKLVPVPVLEYEYRCWSTRNEATKRTHFPLGATREPEKLPVFTCSKKETSRCVYKTGWPLGHLPSIVGDNLLTFQS